MSGQIHDTFGESTVEKKKNNRTILIVIAALIILCICVVIIGFLVIRFTDIRLPEINIPLLSSGGTDHLLIGSPTSMDTPSGNVENDIYLVQPGQDADQETLLFEDAMEFDGIVVDWDRMFERFFIGSPQVGFGGFIPGTNKMLLAFTNDEDGFLYYLQTGQSEPTQIFDSDDYFDAVFMDNGRLIFIVEESSSSYTCYTAINGEESDKLIKADTCFPSVNGKKVVVQENSSGGKSDLYVIDIDGENELTILDGEEYLKDFALSPDGSVLGYYLNNGEEEIIALVDTETGEEIFEEDSYFSPNFIFGVEGNSAIFTGVNDDNEIEIFLIKDGDSERIDEGYKVNAEFTYDNNFVVYMIEDEDGDKTIYVYNIASGDSQELLDGENIHFSIMENPDRILLRETNGDDITFYSTAWNGSNMVELFDNDKYSRNSEYYVKGSNALFMSLSDEEMNVTIFMTPLNEESGDFILEEWEEILLWDLSIDEKYLLFSGREESDDDMYLYVLEIDSGDVIELDDDIEKVQDALFGKNENDIFYTAITGDDFDDIEVRKVNRNGESSPDTLYDESFIIDAGWDLIYPFTGIDWWHQDMQAYQVVEEAVEAPAAEEEVVAEEPEAAATEEPAEEVFEGEPAAEPTEQMVEEPVEEMVISIWTTLVNQNVLDYIHFLMGKFNEENPEISVELIVIENGALNDMFMAASAAGDPPQMILTYSDAAGSFIPNEQIIPVDEYFNMNDFVPVDMVNEAHWSVPMYVDGILMLMYNTDYVEVPPINTDQMIEIATELTGGENYGLVYYKNSAFWFIPWLHGFGGSLFADGEEYPTLNTEEMINALEFVQDLSVNKGLLPEECGYGTADGMFRDSQAAMIITGDWAIPIYQEALGDKFRVYPIPYVSETGLEASAFIQTVGYMIPNYNSTAQVNAAVKFINFATNYDNQVWLTEELDFIPALKAAIDNPVISNDPILTEYAFQVSIGTPFPTDQRMNCVWNAMNPEVELVMNGEKSPEEAAEAMQTAVETCVDDM